MENIEKKILEWKEDLEANKNNKSKLEGKREEILRRAKSELGCSSIEELEEKLKNSQRSIDLLSVKLENLYKQYKEKYESSI